eukprot:XP_004920752.1 PREDICTED: suppression of tumorigenicity 5 protein-like [Xenopus tropicalis]
MHLGGHKLYDPLPSPPYRCPPRAIQRHLQAHPPVLPPSTLSSCSHAIVALLYPFSWQHTFIPVLPSSMIDIVCCPTPFLVGLLSSSLPKLKELPVEEALMVDLGSDRFLRQVSGFNDRDKMSYYLLYYPSCFLIAPPLKG